MKVIFVSRKHGGSRSIELSRWSRALLSLCCLGLPLGLAASGYIAGQESGARMLAGEAQDTPQDQSREHLAPDADTAPLSQRQLQAMTLNLAELEARMTRLDALGQHLTAMADLQEGEFDFSQPPALGGPVSSTFSEDFSSIRFDSALNSFESRLDNREKQLEMLESLLTNSKWQAQASLSGSPVKSGYMSSRYGWRTDPISGKRSMHTGLDFAGKAGSEIVTVASGVVTWTGKDGAYGNTVEISHGDDYVTRYAHAREILVKPGDVVRKGETIALIGSTGRTTGSHVHYEVYKNGRSVDPSSYVARTEP
ncbi:MAG: M23 family metallopeptidase [Halioglobus sp.]|nr:M23 family metallopeptidase [Halioglobus sp.]